MPDDLHAALLCRGWKRVELWGRRYWECPDDRSWWTESDALAEARRLVDAAEIVAKDDTGIAL